MDILVSYSVFIYRFYWVTCTAPVIIGSKCVLLIIDLLIPIASQEVPLLLYYLPQHLTV